MMGFELEAGLIEPPTDAEPNAPIGSFLPFETKTECYGITLLLDRSAARNVTAAMTGLELGPEIDELVQDAVGELLNVIAGQARRAMDAALPPVTVGLPMALSAPPGGGEQVPVAVSLGGCEATLIVQRRALPSEVIARKEAETQLAARESRLAATLDAAAEAIVTLSASGELRGWNRAAEQMFQHTKDAALALHISDIVSGWTTEDALAGRRTVRLEAEGKRADGAGFPIELSASSFRDGTEVGIVCVVRDITERNNSRNKLQVAHKDMIDLSRRAGMAEMAAGVLHNVGNTLNSVVVSTSLMERSVRKSRVDGVERVASLIELHRDDLAQYLTEDPTGARLPAYLRAVADKLIADRAATLQELETLSGHVAHLKKVIASQQGLAKTSQLVEPVCLAELADEALTLADLGDEVAVVRDFGQTAPLTTVRHRVVEILVNLLTNARDAVCASSSASSTITIRLRDLPDAAVIEVEDTGVGMDAATADRIFQHGFTTKANGHGFGLHRSANQAATLNATLSASSDGTGKGAAFRLTFPRKAAEDSGTTP